MKFSTGSLPIGVREYSFVADAGSAGLDNRFFGDVTVLARVEKSRNMIELKVAIRAKAKLVCDRCAKELEREISAKYRMVYFFHERDTGSYPEEDITILPSENTVINITDDVRQYTHLTIPLKVLCTKECKGLCRICGSDLNFNSCSCVETSTDPRWEQLNKLLKQN
jgi:uncharacterized protein